MFFLYPLVHESANGVGKLADVIEFDLDGDRGREASSPLLAPRAMMKRCFEKRPLPTWPALFAPSARCQGARNATEWLQEAAL